MKVSNVVPAEGKETSHSTPGQGIMGKIRESFRQQGVGRTCGWALGKALRRGGQMVLDVQSHLVLEKVLEKKLPHFTANIDITYLYASLPDLEQHRPELNRWRGQYQTYAKRLRAGQVCIFALSGEQLAGQVWITTQDEFESESGYTVHLNDQATYGFDWYVHPDFRKNLVAFGLISEWCRYSQKQNRPRLLAVVRKTNRPSLITLTRVFGFRPVRHLKSLRVFNWRSWVLRESPIEKSGPTP